MDRVVAVEERKRNYYTLDGLRGIAAIAVAMGHYPTFVAPIRIRSAYLAVDLFFMMSGFVLAHAYDHRFRAGMTTSEFMILRVCRLYPLYALATALAIVAIAFALLQGMSVPWTWPLLAIATATGMLFLPAVIPISPFIYPLNPSAWSLGFELIINALFAQFHRTLTTRNLCWIVSVGAIAVVVTVAVVGDLFGGRVPYDIFWTGSVRVFYSFPVGVLLYRLHAQGRWRSPRVPSWLIAIITGAFFVFPLHGASQGLYDIVCCLVVFPTIIWVAVHNEPRHDLKLFTMFGLVSYPVYVFNLPVALVAQGVLRRLLHQSAVPYTPWSGFLLVAFLVALSWLLARYVDPPLRRAMTRALVRRRPPMAVDVRPVRFG